MLPIIYFEYDPRGKRYFGDSHTSTFRGFSHEDQIDIAMTIGNRVCANQGTCSPCVSKLEKNNRVLQIVVRRCFPITILSNRDAHFSCVRLVL